MIKIAIDPGHGGTDRANKGPTGYVEADGNLKAAMYLREELQQTGAFDVFLTRTRDVSLGLRARADMSAVYGADLFLSIHSNAHNGVSKGPECFYSVDLPGDRPLAAKISAAIAKLFDTTDRGAKVRAAAPASPGQSGATASNPEDYYAVIDQAQDRGIPHVLLSEMLFHDNPAEEAILKQDANLRKIAQAMATEICGFYRIPYGEKPKNWEQILAETTGDPESWVAFGKGLVAADAAKVDLGVLRIGCWFPELVEKIYNAKR